MPRRGHRPLRTCLGCGRRDEQDRLIRLAIVEECLVVNGSEGRGGYLHPAAECRRFFIGKKGNHRAFHRELTRAMKEKLIEDLEGRERE